MQLNIDRKTGALLGLIVLLAAAVVSLSVNRNENNVMNNSSGHMGHGSSSSSNANYTGADIMFLQMMIPHHQQAIDISNLALKSSQDPELIELAKIIARDQAAEIKQMKAWLTDAGASEDMGHSMDGMSGMLTQDQISELESSTGREFDRLFLSGMIAHHEGALEMVSMISTSKVLALKTFGETISNSQAEEILAMRELLTDL